MLQQAGDCLIIRQVQQYATAGSQAAALTYVYGFGKLLASRDMVLAYMDKPSAAAEQPFLSFQAAVATRLVGIEISQEYRQSLG